jgi:hypothetical protein
VAIVIGMFAVSDCAAQSSDWRQAPEVPRRGPLARLVENPDQSNGAPPFALTDQRGTIQRYVEPVPGVDLESHVNQVVVVKDDTGPLLLASQLELPNQPLLPMVGDMPSRQTTATGASYQPPRSFNSWDVEQAQYVDNDDSSVQLLPEDVSMPGPNGQLPLLGDGFPNGGPPCCTNGMCGPDCCSPPCGTGCYGPECCNPCGQETMMPYGPIYPQPPMSSCPNCGGYQPGCGCGRNGCDFSGVNERLSDGVHFSGDVEFMFLRPHLTDQVVGVGKFSEKYEFSPRFVLSITNLCDLDGRIRYWHYDRGTNVSAGGDVRLQFDVLDIEGTHRFGVGKSRITLAGGLRLASVQLTDPTGDICDSDMIGLTVAGDGLTPLFCNQSGYCGWVYGARLSLLGGDWSGNPNSAFLVQNFEDDNMLVTELYAGGEVARRCGAATVRGRLLFEMQNWRSDVLAQNAGVQSIGMLGPALQIGADF